ncbi:MAG TPA: chromosome segregation SMC family protein, partial [Candidatus Omnitrophota bacterium]|nr:chromosome segregation SMC family protein [Candidatus Omnitrophota bacterium]
MTYIKKLVMKGFKSFAKKTEVPFVPAINVIMGPNGSGKSNITDALCFVLGRLSAKSMRAQNTSSLIFQGNKFVGPSGEASVEIVFDNSDRAFSIETPEVSIERIVRKNGIGIYKINNESKTRQDVISLLAQAGIDPNGFNIILQGEIQNFVKMHTEERRKIIEEIAGISIYEVRKEKSLRELEKTEEKLKEIATILRERTAYMNNLEKERQEALRYKKLEEDVRKFKASIIFTDLNQKEKEVEAIGKKILERVQAKDKIKKEILGIQNIILSHESRIQAINSEIQTSTGLEQEKLNQEIADLRAQLTSLNVRMENDDKRLKEISKQIETLKNNLKDANLEIEKLQRDSPKTRGRSGDLEQKKKELEELELKRKKFYHLKSELNLIQNRAEDKKMLLSNYEHESRFFLEQIKTISKDLFDKKYDEAKLNGLKISLSEKRDMLENLEKEELSLEKISYSNEHEIENQNALIVKISKMDVCPVCKNKITQEHIHSISRETAEKIDALKKEIDKSDSSLSGLLQKKKIIRREIEDLSSEISKREADAVIFSKIEDRKNQIKSLQEKIESMQGEISEIEKKKISVGKEVEKDLDIEKRYEELRLKIQEIPLIDEEDVDSEIIFKKRELERINSSLRQLMGNEEELKRELADFRESSDEKERILEQKRKQEEELTEKFQRLISERDELQRKIRDRQIEISKNQNEMYNVEQDMNDLKIEDAKLNAEFENLKIELKEFEGIEKIKAPKDTLIERLVRTQETLSNIGSVNLRSLEVYDSVKKEYDSIKEKMTVIESEKTSILEVIKEIDFRKKKTFIKTFNALNEIFSNNFAELSSKGQVSLELEDSKEPFNAGVNVVLKTGHGKYFDVTSLSGGEQTLVALSLIFAIQELKPYPFYLLDEIDAALDKRNSERLALLLKKYMEKGQYIVTSHNDDIILNANNLYGVSMTDGISKIISMKV